MQSDLAVAADDDNARHVYRRYRPTEHPGGDPTNGLVNNRRRTARRRCGPAGPRRSRAHGPECQRRYAMAEAVIVEAVRSPVGKRNGGLSGVHRRRSVRPGAQRPRPEGRHRPRARRRRDLGMRHAGRRAGPRHRAHRGADGRLAGDRARCHRRPSVRIQPAVDSLRRRRRDRRPLRRRRRRRRGVDVAHPDGLLAGQRRYGRSRRPSWTATTARSPTRASAPR